MTDLSALLPEIALLSLTCVVLVVDLYLPAERRAVTYWLTQLTLAVAFLLTLAGLGEAPQRLFDGAFLRDTLGDVLKLFIYGITAGVFLYARPYLRDRGLWRGEFHVLGLFAVLGMMILVSAGSFLSLYLGLELLALSLYALVAFDRDSARASEAAMKYFVLGAMASGMLLYGMSILYGLTGSLDIATVHAQLVRAGGAPDVSVVFGLVFLLVGIAFKFGAVPFHMWVPDVYEGAPGAVTLFVGSAPKIAAFAMIVRLLAEGMGSLQPHWEDMLVVLAALSIGLGNVVAIAQRNLKRMLAYSTISHVGFIFLGMLAGSRQGYAAAMFYSLTYALMAAGGFGMVVLLSRRGHEAEWLDDYRGLNDSHPWFAFLMMLLMLSMAGVPPLVGFYAKLVVLQAVVDAGHVWLAVYAVLMSVVGAYYYLRVVKLMYFDRPLGEAPVTSGLDAHVLLSANSIALLLLGLFPSALMALCLSAFR